jgi:hypothetical protein
MYLFDLIKDTKSLDKLKQEVDTEEAEQLSLLEKYRAQHGDRIQGVSLFEPFNPASDFGKLVIGGKITLSKGSQLEPEHRILIAQAAYLRVELKELIAMKSRKQSSLVKRKAIDEPGVVGWIQSKKRVASVTKSGGTGATKQTQPAAPTAASPPHWKLAPDAALPATQAKEVTLAVAPAFQAPAASVCPAPSIFPATVNEGACRSDGAPNPAPTRVPSQAADDLQIDPSSVPYERNIVPPAALVSAELHGQTAVSCRPADGVAEVRPAPPVLADHISDPVSCSACTVEDSSQSAPVSTTSRLVPGKVDGPAACPCPPPTATAGGVMPVDPEPSQRLQTVQQHRSDCESAKPLDVSVEKKADEDDGMLFYQDIMEAALF